MVTKVQNKILYAKKKVVKQKKSYKKLAKLANIVFFVFSKFSLLLSH